VTRKAPKSAQERTNIERADIYLEAEVQADPVKALRDQMTRMLVCETRINSELYSSESIDHSALSASNKRIIELGQALKALPSQSAGENKGGQRSTAELIVDHFNRAIDEPAMQEVTEVKQTMLARAADAFGEGK
jgi:hypothetical protein